MENIKSLLRMVSVVVIIVAVIAVITEFYTPFNATPHIRTLNEQESATFEHTVTSTLRPAQWLIDHNNMVEGATDAP